MIPARPSRIFRSRWWALFWAAGVIWTAVSVAGSAPHGESKAQARQQAKARKASRDDGGDSSLTDADGQPVSNQQIQMIANLVG